MPTLLRLTALGAGASLFALSFVPAWVAYRRRIVGYGTAHVVGEVHAWAPLATEVLAIAAVLALVAALVAVLGSAMALTARTQALAWVGLGTAGALLILYAREVAVPSARIANRLELREGPLLPVGLALAIVIAATGVAGLAVAARRHRRLPDWIGSRRARFR